MPNSPHSSKRSAPSLRIEPARSRVGRVALGAITLLAWFALTQTALPKLLIAALALAVLVIGWRGWRQIVHPPILVAVLQTDGSWLLATRDGERAARLTDASQLAGAIGLIFTSIDQKSHWRWLLWPDALPIDQARRLRVWLSEDRRRRAADRDQRTVEK